jgi:hypothetical protein
MNRGLGTGDTVQQRGYGDNAACVLFQSSETSHRPHPESAEAACLSSAGLRRAPRHRGSTEEHERGENEWRTRKFPGSAED